MDTNDILACVARLTDPDLLARVQDLAQREREATIALVAHLAELDERRLYLGEGYPSLFKYCTDVLHLSEHAAYNRIETARAVRQFPVLLEHLAAGWVTLFAVRRLAPHLTSENHRDVLTLARHRSKQEIEELIARLRPQPAVPDVIRKLPTRTRAASTVPLQAQAQDAPSAPWDDGTHEGVLPIRPSATAAPALPPAQPSRRAVVRPLAPERYKVVFTASAEVHAKLREAQALLRHQIPDGDLEKVFDRALEALLANLRKQKRAATVRPREHRSQASGAEPRRSASSRHIPATVRRTVWARDGGRCAFVSTNGRRCAEEGFLEFHHIVPYASGGPSSVDNIELRCRAHNGYEAVRHFGQWDAAAVREKPAVYAPDASAVAIAAVPGDRPISSFRNELEPGASERLSESDFSDTLPDTLLALEEFCLGVPRRSSGRTACDGYPDHDLVGLRHNHHRDVLNRPHGDTGHGSGQRDDVEQPTLGLGTRGSIHPDELPRRNHGWAGRAKGEKALAGRAHHVERVAPPGGDDNVPMDDGSVKAIRLALAGNLDELLLDLLLSFLRLAIGTRVPGERCEKQRDDDDRGKDAGTKHEITPSRMRRMPLPAQEV